jgi:hypothetical protein
MKWPTTKANVWLWMKWIVGIVATILMLKSLYIAKYEFGVGFSKEDPVKMLQAKILCFWILVPPIWFWFEYYFLYTEGKNGMEELKHGQDQSAKVWLALITVLFGLYFGKDLIRDSSPPSDTQQSSSRQQSQRQSQYAPSSGAPAANPSTAQLH